MRRMMMGDRPVWYFPPDKPLFSLAEVAQAYAPYHLVGTVPILAHSTVHTGHEMIEVSTVFLKMDHNLGFYLADPDGTVYPVLWETMIFGGPLDCWTWRYASPEVASVGHRQALTELWTALDLADTPALITVTSYMTWWRDPSA